MALKDSLGLYNRSAESIADEFLNKFGSHFCPNALLGGRWEISALASSESAQSKYVMSSAVSAATHSAIHASETASVSNIFFNAHEGAGASAEADAHGSSGSGEATRNAFTAQHTEVRQAWFGGNSGAPLKDWRESLSESHNSNWEVLDRHVGSCIGVWKLLEIHFQKVVNVMTTKSNNQTAQEASRAEMSQKVWKFGGELCKVWFEKFMRNVSLSSSVAFAQGTQCPREMQAPPTTTTTTTTATRSGCAGNLVVSGTTHGRLLDGSYSREYLPLQYGRPVYEKPCEASCEYGEYVYMFYWAPTTSWILGVSYTSARGWASANSGYEERCPPMEVGAWREWDPSAGVWSTTSMILSAQTADACGGNSWFDRVSGPCEYTMAGGGPCCVTSPNYPDSYGASENCHIRVNAAAGPLSVYHFDTESGEDKLRVNGVWYSGEGLGHGPNYITPEEGTDIVWTSDFSVEDSGWKVCN